MTIRFLVQQVDKASLLVDNQDEWIHINKGILVYIVFLKGANAEEIKKCEINYDTQKQKNVSVVDIQGDVLFIPQASLIGKLKGNKLQYHGLIEKDQGAELYRQIVDATRIAYEKALSLRSNEAPKSEFIPNERVKHGTYGNRQALKMDSPGPFTHQFDIDLSKDKQNVQ